MKRKNLLGGVSLLCALMLLAIYSTLIVGQQGTSTVRGLVKDPQGNVVPGASVKLTNLGTNLSRSTTTSDTGTYSFDFIQVGDYRLEVEAKGFKKAFVNEVHALVAKAATIDVQLEVGNVSETITITSGTGEVLVNRDDATLGNNFINKQITQLPLEARSVTSLLTLQPGVTREGYVSGARSDQSNVTLDGIDINDAQTNQIGPATGTASSDNTESDLVFVNGTTMSPDATTVIRLTRKLLKNSESPPQMPTPARADRLVHKYPWSPSPALMSSTVHSLKLIATPSLQRTTSSITAPAGLRLMTRT